MTDDALRALRDAAVLGWDIGRTSDETCCIVGRVIDGVQHIEHIAYGKEAEALIAQQGAGKGGE